MISAVKAKGFKGLTFTQELGPKNIFFGGNGSGKSARKEALILGVNGPTGKQNSAVLNAYGKGENPVEVGIKIVDTWFDRIFKKAKSSVTQIHKINNKKVDKIKFATEMGKAIGTVSAFDVSSFVDASDKKKISQVFDLFPPEGDVSSVEDEIDALKTEINARHASIRVAEELVAKLTKSIAETELPPGTLAMTVNDKEKIANEIDVVQAEIQKEKDAEAKRIADEKTKKAEDDARVEEKAKAKEQADKTAKKTAADTKRQVEVAVIETEKQHISPDGVAAEQQMLNKMSPKKRAQIVDPQQVASNSYDVGIKAVETIIDVINNMKECNNCFAEMVANAELKKLFELKKTSMIKF